jgi:hypothetical protein
MSKGKTIGIIVSLMLHLFLLFILLWTPQMYEKLGNPKTESKPVEVTLKVMEHTPARPEQSKNDLPANKPKYETDSVICSGKDKTYVGVGLVYQPGSNLVTRAPPGLPAYDAGVRIGDFILDPDAPMINGYITFNIRRSFTFLVFHIKADNICFQEG